MTKSPTNEEIMVALCCGSKCKPGKNTGKCHRWDFDSEAKRIRALLDALDKGTYIPSVTLHRHGKPLTAGEIEAGETIIYNPATGEVE